MTASVSRESAFATRTLAEIAATLPGAAGIFRHHKLDFCCGGRATLADAAIAKGISPNTVAAELDAAAAQIPAPALPESTEDLITLIETRYHAAHRRELPELVRLTRRVEAVHKEHANAPHGLAALLETMGRELETHMEKEEAILFPLMRRGGHPMIAQPIAVLLAEHDDHGACLREMERLTHDFTPPADACPTWRALCTGCRKFADDLIMHIHTENNILFPRFAG